MAVVDELSIPRTLADVPLPRLEPLELLGLRPGADGRRRSVPDHDFDGYGYGIARDLVLESADGTRCELAGAVVLALHCTDAPPSGATIELELDVPGPSGTEPLTVLAPLDAFLRAHAPALPREPADVVLALCNPHALAVERPPELSGRPLHHARGDVLSWLDLHDDGRARIRLHAHSWHQQ